jgi:excisionase family DNA binding protein
MAEEEYRPSMKEFLDMLADLLSEKYFERMDDRMKKIPELRRLITAKEASQYLSLATDTVYRMAAMKKLPYLKIGDRVLFDLKALDHWVERHLVREKEMKRQELKTEIEKGKTNTKSSKESGPARASQEKGKSNHLKRPWLSEKPPKTTVLGMAATPGKSLTEGHSYF